MRRLLCLSCGEKWPKEQHPEDAAQGFSWRRVLIEHVKKPQHHYITINGVAQEEMKTLRCDGCNAEIPDGTPAVAVSQYRGKMSDWEKEYSQ